MSTAESADPGPHPGPVPSSVPGSVAGPVPGARRRPVPADLLTIGEVLGELRDDFPDVSHSKIRFLEDRGLVSPARTPSGYRKFSRPDVARLRLVLSLQRDHYLPLRVIGEHVAALDAGRTPPRLAGEPAGAGPAPAAAQGEAPAEAPGEVQGEVQGGVPAGPRHARPEAAPAVDRAPRAVAGPAAPPARPAPADPPAQDAPEASARQAPGAAAPSRRLDRGELVAVAGGDAALVDALESHGLLPRAGAAGYPGEAGDVVTAAQRLGAFGIEPRHLRALRTAAEREATLVEAVVSPLRRVSRGGPDQRAGAPERRDRAAEVADELAATLLRLHGSLLRAALDGAQG